jgi:hypothetical protein
MGRHDDGRPQFDHGFAAELIGKLAALDPRLVQVVEIERTCEVNTCATTNSTVP